MALQFLNNGYFAGKVGIGTVATDYSLEVVDQTDYGGIFIVGGNAPGLTIKDQSSTSESKIYVQSVASPGSSGNLRISADNNSTALDPTIEFQIAGSEKMRIVADGNIGMSVAPTASGTTTNLEMIGGSTFASRNTAGVPQLYISSNGVGQGYTQTYKQDGFATQYVMQGFDGAHTFKTAISGTAGDAISYLMRMKILNNGNVGIGEPSPNNKLEITEAVDYDPSATGDGQLGIGGNGYNFAIAMGDTTTSLYHNSSGRALSLGTNEIDRLTVSGGGNIQFNNYGAGTLITDSSGNITATTSPPGTGVFVPLAGGAAVGEKMTGTLYGTSTNMSGAGTYAGSMTLGNGAAAAEAHLTIGQGRTGNGYSYIDLVGDATYTDYGFRIIRGNGGANTTSELVHRGTGNFSLVSSDGGDIALIPNAGNVGIGTTTPENKLHVQQSGLFTGIPSTAGIRIKSDGGSAIDNYHGTIALSRGTGSVAISAVQEATDSDVMGMAFFTHPSTTGGDAAVEQMRLDQNGNVGIGITAPTSKLHINQYVTNPALDLPASFAVEIDSNHSGSAATTGDREQGGLFIDVDSSTTGGDTSDEHRVYGVYSDVKHSGDADRATGVYSIAEQNTTAGSTAYVLGGEFIGVTDGGASAAVNTVAGVWGAVSIQDATPVVNSYGGYFRNSQAVNRTGATTSTYGLYTEVELNSDSAYTNIYGQRITIDVNTDAFTASSIIGLDFSFTGETDIPAATEVFAIRQPANIRSYFQGDFGIGTATPKSKLQVAGGIQMADDTDAATINKVGTMRYRTGTEYVDVTGGEKVINGDFTTDVDWNKNPNWTISGGTANADGTSNADMNQIPYGGYPGIGDIWRIRFEITARTQGQVRVSFGGAATGFVEDVKQYEYIVTAVSTDRTRIQCSSSFIGSVDNVSIVQVIAEDASYADMCMQTGSSTYEWVNIVRNTY